MMALGLSRLSYFDIGKIARNFLDKHHLNNTLPVPIEEIAESKLDISIVPIKRLKTDFDVDGSLDSTLTTIFIDYDMYCDPRYENRLRFTIAHEVGHLVLHRDIFLDLAINSPEDL